MIVISFCAQYSKHGIIALDDSLNEVASAAIKRPTTGLAVHDGRILAVYDGSKIVTLNHKFDLLDQYNTGGSDIHSLAVRGDEVFFVETARDRIMKAQMKNGILQGQPDTVFEFHAGGRDEYHANSLCFRGDEMIFSFFGKRVQPFRGWVSQDYTGTIASNTHEFLTGLGHPHSLLNHNGDIYFLESRTGTLFKNFSPILSLEGYARGLAKTDGGFLIGLSKSRNEEVSSVECATVVKVSDEGGLLDAIEFPEFAEIYDIILV